jgi:hypothetical protein
VARGPRTTEGGLQQRASRTVAMDCWRGRHRADLAGVARRPELGYAAGAVSWMVSGHATWKTGPLLHVAKAIPEAETINNVDQQVLAMAFAIIRYFGDKSAGSKRQRFAR